MTKLDRETANLTAEKKAREAELATLRAQENTDAKLKVANHLTANPGGTIRVFCQAGYVAKFSASWKELKDPKSTAFERVDSWVEKSWSSGKLSTGRRKNVTIPPHSENVILSGESVDPAAGTIFQVSPPEFGKEYKVYGTISKKKLKIQ